MNFLSKSEFVLISAVIKKALMVFWICGAVMQSGCSSPQPVTTDWPQGKVSPGVIMVLPFKNMSEIWGKNASLRCPFTNRVHVTGEVESDTVKIMTNKLVAGLIEIPGLQLIPPGQGLAMQSNLLPEADNRFYEPELLQEAGKQIGADTALLGRIYRFQERVGRSFSAERPASVNFDLVLVRISDGQVLWYGNFDETQQSLSENLFQLNTFIRRRAKWLTAEDLADYGLEKLLSSFQNMS